MAKLARRFWRGLGACSFALAFTASLPAEEPATKIPALKLQPAKRAVVLRLRTEPFLADEEAAASPETAAEATAVATHQQSGVIAVWDDQFNAPVHTFCLDAQGQLLVGCGEGKAGEIRVYNAEGKYLQSWSVPMTPEAIAPAADGSLLIGGSGKLARLNASGEVTMSKELPHAEAARENVAAIQKDVVAQHEQMASLMTQQVDSLKEQIKEIESKEEKDRSELENARLEAFKQALTANEEYLKQQPAELSEEQLNAQVEAAVARKMHVAAVSQANDAIYLACYASEGYGFDVWKFDAQGENGAVVVSSLRGCCGHMYVQACENGLYVAENSMHRVTRYSPSGEVVRHWGSRGEQNEGDAFSSCCNPMNLAFGANGEVYTAESNTGRIKKFTAEGDFVSLIGSVELVPGCKNVSIAVDSNTDRVYMLDITRGQIMVMSPVQDDAVAAESPKASPRIIN